MDAIVSFLSSLLLLRHLPLLPLPLPVIINMHEPPHPVRLLRRFQLRFDSFPLPSISFHCSIFSKNADIGELIIPSTSVLWSFSTSDRLEHFCFQASTSSSNCKLSRSVFLSVWFASSSSSLFFLLLVAGFRLPLWQRRKRMELSESQLLAWLGYLVLLS